MLYVVAVLCREDGVLVGRARVPCAPPSEIRPACRHACHIPQTLADRACMAPHAAVPCLRFAPTRWDVRALFITSHPAFLFYFLNRLFSYQATHSDALLTTLAIPSHFSTPATLHFWTMDTSTSRDFFRRRPGRASSERLTG